VDAHLFPGMKPGRNASSPQGAGFFDAELGDDNSDTFHALMLGRRVILARQPMIIRHVVSPDEQIKFLAGGYTAVFLGAAWTPSDPDRGAQWLLSNGPVHSQDNHVRRTYFCARGGPVARIAGSAPWSKDLKQETLGGEGPTNTRRHGCPNVGPFRPAVLPAIQPVQPPL